MNRPSRQRLFDRTPRFRAAAFDRGQRGAVLVIGLIILLLVSLISVTGANRTLLDEHMASNQYTQTNGFLAAEAGISAALNIANNSTNNPKSELAKAVASGDKKTINEKWGALVSSDWQPVNDNGSTNQLSAAQYKLVAPASCPYTPSPGNKCWWLPAKDAFQVESQGRMANGARRNLEVEIKPANSAGLSPFLGGVIADKSLPMSGGSYIDIYNSRLGSGDYGAKINPEDANSPLNTSKSNPEISGLAESTCGDSGQISLSGGVPVYGDLSGTGGLDLSGGAKVLGSVHVNGDVTISGGTVVQGNLTTGGSVTLTGGTVGGNLLAGGDLNSGGDLGGNADVYGDVNFTNSSSTDPGSTVTATGNVQFKYPSNPPQTIYAGGSITYPQSSGSANPSGYHANVANISLPPITPISSDTKACNPFKGDTLGSIFDSVENDPRLQLLTDWLTPSNPQRCRLSNGDHLCYQTNGSNVSLYGDDSGTMNLGVDGEKTLFQVKGNLSNAGHLTTLNILGNVTLLIGGNFSTTGGLSINIGPSSSLRLLVDGTTNFAGGSELNVSGPFVRTDANGDQVPAVAVYSRYDSGTSGAGVAGVSISGGNSSYIAVYAPKANVSVSGGGAIYGSVVAQSISTSGGAVIHYDQALENVREDTSGPATAAKLLSWQQLQGS